jgi:hypothetical protein
MTQAPNEKAPAPVRTDARSRNQERPNNTTTGTDGKVELPQWLRDLIACPPQHGQGVHQWLFKVARQLHAHRDPQTIVSLLQAACDGCGRHVPEGEIIASVESAKSCAWTPNGTAAPITSKPVSKWPAVNQATRQAVIDSATHRLPDLCEVSPLSCTIDSTDAEFFIDQLFPGNPLLCVGLDKAKFTTAPRESFRGKLSELALIVPSAMSALTGTRKADGKQSSHTLANTGPRQFLVTEFDSGTVDEQVAILWHLRRFAPLAMVLSSGGKSLHGWWSCEGVSEEQTARFFRYAVSMGADPATWTRSQFVRLPQGWRADKKRRQEVYYFNPEAVRKGTVH